MKQVEVTVWVHPTYGEARVFWRWKEAGEGMRWVPVGVEFDVFTPDDEQEAMLAELLHGEVYGIPAPPPQSAHPLPESAQLPLPF